MSTVVEQLEEERAELVRKVAAAEEHFGDEVPAVTAQYGHLMRADRAKSEADNLAEQIIALRARLTQLEAAGAPVVDEQPAAKVTKSRAK